MEICRDSSVGFDEMGMSLAVGQPVSSSAARGRKGLCIVLGSSDAYSLVPHAYVYPGEACSEHVATKVLSIPPPSLRRMH